MPDTPTPPVSSLSWPSRALLAAFRASASLQLAVVLIAIYIVVLAWATAVMSQWYADEELKYGIYNSWWFVLLNALLGINVLNAALVRLPWRRRHTGFLVTHAGIIVLLVGSWVSYRYGVDASLAIFEGTASNRAFQSQHHFELQLDDGQKRSGTQPIVIPFRAGPFNWSDYGAEHAWLPWGLVRRDQGVIYEEGDVRLEVLDYYHDSQRRPAPRVDLRLRPLAAGADRRLRSSSEDVTVAISASSPGHPHAATRPFGMGGRAITADGHRINFWMSGDAAETTALLDSAPEGDLGQLGQIVLHHDGKNVRLNVDDLTIGQRQPLGETGLEVELAAINSRMTGIPIPAVSLTVYRDDAAPQRMTLYAALPHWNTHDRVNRVFGTYWAPVVKTDDDAQNEMAAQVQRDTRAARLDILQGHDQKLYYRTWRSPGAYKVGQLGDRPLTAFENTEDALAVELVSHVARDKPGWENLPKPYVRKPETSRQPRAKVRLSIGETTEEFWLAGPGMEPSDDQQHRIEADGRTATLSMPANALELGFEVFLHRFEQKLDPGARRSSYFASLVDFRKPTNQSGDEPQVLEKDVLITLNDPKDFVDPENGRSYRLFQTSFTPPRKPGDPLYEQLVRADEHRPKLYQSILSVNHDPGRALKYAGSMLIVVGISILYYIKVRARRRARTTDHA